MGTRELKVGLTLVLIFASGVLCGVLLNRQVTAPQTTQAPSAGRPRGGPLLVGRDAAVLAELTDKLKLTPAQQQSVGEILRPWSEQVKRSRQESLQQRLEMFEKTMLIIRTNLTAEQIPAYEEIVERARRRHRQAELRTN
ncbi:MAG TPA: hypothetical protein VNO52_07765 [Methylomirabilota bacterium]|nr:hypothetical protein [Methylomirabilota bacterium]